MGTKMEGRKEGRETRKGIRKEKERGFWREADTAKREANKGRSRYSKEGSERTQKIGEKAGRRKQTEEKAGRRKQTDVQLSSREYQRAGENPYALLSVSQTFPQRCY